MNQYGFGDPINNADPSGLEPNYVFCYPWPTCAGGGDGGRGGGFGFAFEYDGSVDVGEIARGIGSGPKAIGCFLFGPCGPQAASSQGAGSVSDEVEFQNRRPRQEGQHPDVPAEPPIVPTGGGAGGNGGPGSGGGGGPNAGSGPRIAGIYAFANWLGAPSPVAVNWAWPTDSNVVISYWGEVSAIRGGRPHRGVDIRARRGRPFYAVRSGTVIESWYARRGGSQLGIEHSLGWVWGYAHGASTVQLGDRVGVGEVIAFSDGSGSVSPHLHLSLRLCPTCERVDPLDYMWWP
jgi:murein DD-endopeptidase MepM/ murein hydrolase activator NlpD